MITSKLIFYGNYRLFSNGRLERATPGGCTYPGREIHPYANPSTNFTYVKLSRNGVQTQFNFELLMSYHFG